MPTKRRHRGAEMRPEFEELGDNGRYELLYGDPLMGPSDFPDVDAMRQAWELHREELLAEWIAERPGSRPFAWWLFEGVPKHGERPIVDGRFAAVYVREAWLTRGILQTNVIDPRTGQQVQEAERNFLARHGELTPEEQ